MSGRQLARVAAAPVPSVLGTKLVPPVAREGLIERPQLVEALDVLASRPLTLVSAPAGYGKTSVLTAWSRSHSVESVAWLTLDELDSDPVRFWASVAEAVDRAKPGAGRRSATTLRARGVAPYVAQTELLGDLALAAPLAIVLDDLHVVEDDECLALLERAVEYLPPGVRLVVGTRRDPPLSLARLRAHGLLGEVRAVDLAFTPEEARRLLVDAEGLDLGEEEVALLVQRTEGWPVALYLTALWLRGEEDPRALAREFAGGHRYVAEYLASEVLNRLDPPTREFLVRASVFDRFCASLCDDVLQFENSHALLTETSLSNLLLVPLDEVGEWFRLHHLLDELLSLELERTEGALVPDLHRRAASWFRAHDLPEVAFEHALAAGDDHLAANILSEAWPELLRRSEAETFMRLVARLPLEIVLVHPELAAASAMATVGTRATSYERARWLSIAEHARVESPETWTVHAELVVSTTRALAIDGDVGRAVVSARRAIELAKERGGDEQEVLALATLAYALYLDGRAQEAEEAASRAVTAINAPRRPHGVVRALGTLALIASDAGRTGEAAATATRALDRAGSGNFTTAPSVATAHLARGRALAAHGKLQEAEAATERGERLSRSPEPSVSHAHALLVLAEVRVRRGRIREAREALHAALGEIKTFEDPGRLPRLAARVKRSIRAPRAVAALHTEPLSPAELVVLDLLTTDLSQRGIGRQLFLSVNTIKTHTRSIYRKLDVASRQDAVVRGEALGLIGAHGSPG